MKQNLLLRIFSTSSKKYSAMKRILLFIPALLFFGMLKAQTIVIQVPGQTAITYPNGFVINNFIYPYTWSEVQGPSWFCEIFEN